MSFAIFGFQRGSSKRYLHQAYKKLYNPLLGLCNEMFERYWPFLSYLKPLFQSEAKCKAIDVKMIFSSYASITHFHNKGFALNLVLKVKGFGTQKWPFGLSLICVN